MSRAGGSNFQIKEVKLRMARVSSGRKVRVQITLRLDELTALDDWRFANRMPSRAAALRELLRRGLSSENAPE